jgi:hypothetical protein
VIFSRLIMVLCLVPVVVFAGSGGGDKTVKPSAVCRINGEVLAVGQSQWVEDPSLVSLGGSRDWHGFNVTCRETVTIQPSNGEPGGVIKVTGTALVLSELSEELYQMVEEGLNN